MTSTTRPPAPRNLSTIVCALILQIRSNTSRYSTHPSGSTASSIITKPHKWRSIVAGDVRGPDLVGRGARDAVSYARTPKPLKEVTGRLASYGNPIACFETV